MTQALQRALAQALGEPVVAVHAIGGGDINDAYRVELASGRLFAKTRAQPVPGMYVREAEGLRWLREAGALRVPAVRAVDERFLVLEWIDSARRGVSFDEQLGAGLAALHRAGALDFGFTEDNFIGPLPQPNAPRPDWATFYREQRLLPLLERAKTHGRVDIALHRRFDALFARLDELVGPAEPPARLHGDLWSGNVLADERGAPALIDPAVYGGHREVDLAMLELFGAPSPRFFAAYEAVYPLSPGRAERVALYQLYPLLVHVCLFGRGYSGQLASTLERALRGA